MKKWTDKLFMCAAIVICFCGFFRSVTLAQNAPASAPVIKAEDALAISKLQTESLANLYNKAQIEAAYKRNVEDAQQISVRMNAARAAALKNAGADPEKFDVDSEKLVIIPKPPVKEKK